MASASDISPAQIEHFVAAASGERQQADRGDGFDALALAGVERMPEPGEFVAGEETFRPRGRPEAGAGRRNPSPDRSGNGSILTESGKVNPPAALPLPAVPARCPSCPVCGLSFVWPFGFRRELRSRQRILWSIPPYAPYSLQRTRALTRQGS